ncbi:hypothetical protein BU16DRAFT_545178 [Lophium mytilinum]|uniref:Uncharacterized protein n=1 Tax=Lophium mytilinum TaxID=390894 RepID=A0A6A6Q8U2_9PEZI|nr:hypothetical protein BU16DRAFT_545178 [Lophium mytilinum]
MPPFRKAASCPPSGGNKDNAARKNKKRSRKSKLRKKKRDNLDSSDSSSSSSLSNSNNSPRGRSYNRHRSKRHYLRSRSRSPSRNYVADALEFDGNKLLYLG